MLLMKLLAALALALFLLSPDAITSLPNSILAVNLLSGQFIFFVHCIRWQINFKSLGISIQHFLTGEVFIYFENPPIHVHCHHCH